MDIDTIIEALGGGAQVQTLLGVGPSAVSNYRLRGNFPEYARIKIWQALKARGINVDPETLQQDESPPQPPTARILIIVSGSIAAYKSLELIRRMKENDLQVNTILTQRGSEFITPLSVSALSGEKTYTDLFSLTDEIEMGHIALARSADIVVIAPASADFIAKMAGGLANDLATTAILATDAPVLIAPAMNPFMWANPATQANCATLSARGMHFIGPDAGDMACGEEGAGRLVDVGVILDEIKAMLPRIGALSGKRALVTSGPTHEPIDPARYIANRSSGKQGHAIAAALARAGASVSLVTGPVSEPSPHGVKTIAVQTAQEMLTASLAVLPCDIAVCAAAVADWSVATPSQGKLKKTASQPPALHLKENPDILALISRHQGRPDLVIGFAAETTDIVANGNAKRINKGCDWILANDVSDSAVFGQENNQVHLITDTGTELWAQMSKSRVAEKLVDVIIKEKYHIRERAHG